MKRISAKKNFSPLKPLRSLNINKRRNSMSSHADTKNQTKSFDKNLKKRQIHKKLTSLLPFITNLLDIPLNDTQNNIIKQDNNYYKCAEPSLPIFLNSFKPLNKEKSETEKKHPIFHHTQHIIKINTIENNPEHFKKNSQNLIAYIPTASFIDEKEDSNDIYHYNKAKNNQQLYKTS